jgi:DNA-binding NarL/FixJ family response regulator
MELLGRDRQLASAARAIGDVRRGSGRVLGLFGEAGLGKSALLAEISERARAAGLRVVAARGVEHERDMPYGVICDALGEQAGTPGAVPVAERFRRHREIAASIEELAPVALLLDDLHWADEASIELVLHLLRRPVALPVLLVVAARPVGPAGRLLDAGRSASGWEELALTPLADEDARAMVAGLADAAVRERVVLEGRGNPLFLRELARVADRGEASLPATLVAAVHLEVAALNTVPRALIEGAAVAGDPFDPELAAAAAELDAEDALAALDELVAADLVRPHNLKVAGTFMSPRGFVFRHPLVRRAVYDGASPGWRLGAHERAAVALAERGAGPVERAFHVVRSAHVGDLEAVAALAAAAEATGQSSPAAAAHWYAAALRLVPDAEHATRADLLTREAVALLGTGQLSEARAALLEAQSLTPSLDIVIGIARVESHMGLHADARRRLLAARAEAPAARRGMLAMELAGGSFFEGRVDELRRWADPAVEATQDDPVLLTGAEALAALGALWDRDPDAAWPLLDSATRRLDALTDEALGPCVTIAFFVATAQLLCERFADAASTSARALKLVRETGQSAPLVTLLGVRAMALTQMLELDAAIAEAEAAEDAARLQAQPHLLHFALWIRSIVHDVRGEPTEAERAVLEANRLSGLIEPSKLTRTAACDFASLDEDPRRAMDGMLAAAGERLETADPTWQSRLLLRLVRAAIGAGELDDAEQWASSAATFAEETKLPAAVVRAATACAEVLLARGDAVEAAAVAEEAVALGERAFTSGGAPLDVLEARLVAGRALAAAGDARAREVLQRVAADSGVAGATGLHDAAGRELRKVGSRVSAPTRRAARRDTTLSDREREIAALVSEGRSNKQVAATLYLSEKTIENALTTIYAKLGVRSRVELSLRFHLDGPAGVEQGVDEEHRGRGADVPEDLAVRRHRALGVGGRRQQRPGADDVRGGRPRLGESGEDDLPAAAGLFRR